MKKEIPNKVLFAVYGTLKNGHGNNYLLQEEGVTFKGEHITEPRFTMVSCGGFPAVHCVGDTSIYTEIFEVTNPNVIARIYGLEGYSGRQGSENNWYDVENIETPYGQASMFVFRKEPSRPVVRSGKW